MSVWYCLSIIGFNVHTCSAEGVSHVMTSFTSIDCETIHGGHHHSCCHGECEADHHHHDASDDCSCRTEGATHIHAKECCTDDYQVIALTGIRIDDNHGHYDECHCGHCPCVEATASETLPLLASVNIEDHIVIPDSGLIVPEIQALFSIWRI